MMHSVMIFVKKVRTIQEMYSLQKEGSEIWDVKIVNSISLYFIFHTNTN